jgi:hypothetical protein
MVAKSSDSMQMLPFFLHDSIFRQTEPITMPTRFIDCKLVLVVIITEILIFFSSGVKFISIFHFFSDNVELGVYAHSPQGYQQVGNPAPEGHDYSSGNCLSHTKVLQIVS